MLRCAIALSLWVACVSGQVRSIESARALLASHSLVQRALGAREAYSGKLTELLPDPIRELANRQTITPSDQEKLYTYTLFDALIQLRAVVPLDVLDRFYPVYMDEVVILWVFNAESSDRMLRERKNAPGSGPWEAMTAALIARRDDRIASALVREMSVSQTFNLTDDGRPVRGDLLVSAGPCGAVRRIDFPATGRYTLTTDGTQGSVPLVSLKFGTVYYRRQVLATADTVAFRENKVPPSDAPIRFAYLADLLGDPWRPADVESILSRRTDVRWRGQHALKAEVRRELEKQSYDVQAIIADLKKAGLLEEETLRTLDLRIVPVVEDRREWPAASMPYVPPARLRIE